MRIIFCHSERSREILRSFGSGLRPSLRITAILLSVIAISSCGYRGPLKSPSQIKAEEAKKAQKKKASSTVEEGGSHTGGAGVNPSPNLPTQGGEE